MFGISQKYIFFENQDQRRAAAHSGTKAAEAEPVAEPVHKAASWLNWFVKTFLKEFVDGSLMLNWALNLGLNKRSKACLKHISTNQFNQEAALALATGSASALATAFAFAR